MTQELGPATVEAIFRTLERLDVRVNTLTNHDGQSKIRDEAIMARLDKMNGSNLRTEGRVSRLENWKWMIFGGFSVVSFGIVAIAAFSFLL